MKESEEEGLRPLVSIGIPTYNRAHGLKRTLEFMVHQSYQNLEIIVSDNASPDPKVRDIAEKYAERDSRVRYFKQCQNKGPHFNFNYVLEKASGEYFMWAADDDEWIYSFIETCIDEFMRLGPAFVAVAMEAQYFDETGMFEYFSEGKPFYNFSSSSRSIRLAHTLKFNFGNLMYGLFRRDALFRGERSIFRLFKQRSLNEIFLFLFLSSRGSIRVIPKVGLYKRTNPSTYRQARWEKTGGLLPDSKGYRYLKKLPYISSYHARAFFDITSAIDVLELSILDRIRLKWLTFVYLLRHCSYFLLRSKKKAF